MTELERKWRTWIDCCPSSKIVNIAPEPFANEMLFHRAVKRKCKELGVPYVVGEKYDRPHFYSDGERNFSDNVQSSFYLNRDDGVEEVMAYLIYMNEGFWKIGKAPVPTNVAYNWKRFIDIVGELHIDLDEVIRKASQGRLMPTGYLLLKDKERFSDKKKEKGLGVYALTPVSYFHQTDFDGKNASWSVWYQAGSRGRELDKPDFNIVRSRYREYVSPVVSREVSNKYGYDTGEGFIYLGHLYDNGKQSDTWEYWVEQHPKKFDPDLLREYRRCFKEFSSLANQVHKEKRVYNSRLKYYQGFYQDPLLFEPDIINWDLMKNEVVPNLQYDLAKFNLYVSRGL